MDQGRRQRLTEAEWLRHYSFIRRLYLLDVSLKDLTTLLHALEDFPVTKAQLEYKLKQWNISKNIDGDLWRSIDRCIGKRKRQGKESDVFHCGKRVKQSTIDKETYRHRDKSIIAPDLPRSPPESFPISNQIVVCTPQPYATESLVKWLLSSGQDPNTRFLRMNRLSTPLEQAILSRRLNTIEQLLVAGADLKITFEYSPHQSLLSLVLRNRVCTDEGTRIVKMLLQHCKTLRPEEVLHAAIRLQDWNLLEEALERGADFPVAVQTQSYLPEFEKTDLVYKETALSAAAAVGIDATRSVFSRLQIQHQSIGAASFVTPDVFISAACAGNTDIISYLHEVNPVGGLANQHGITPLQVAVKEGHLEACQLLFQLYRESSATLLFIASCSDQLDILRYFLASGVDVNTTILSDDEAACKFLLWFRDVASFRHQITQSQSPTALELLVHNALCIDHQDAIEILVRSGASLPTDAIAKFSTDGLDQLLSAALDSGGDPNAQASYGASALECAVRGGHLNCVELLLERGAELHLSTPGVLEALLPTHVCHIDGIPPRGNPCLKALLLAHGAGAMNIGEGGGSHVEAAIVAQDDAQLKTAFSELPTYYSPSALCSAVLIGSDWVIDVLLANRPSQAQHDPLEGTAIGLAAKSGNLTLVRKLVTQLQKPETALLPFLRFHRSSPFSFSRMLGLIASDEIFFWHNKRGDFGQGSPLALAASCQEIDGFLELIRHGYHSDSTTWARVVGMGASECLKALMDYNQRTGSLPPPPLAPTLFLEYAIEKGMEEVVLCLIKSGTDTNGHDRLERVSRSPFQLAIQLGHSKIVDHLLQAGASINAPPSFYRGATPLQIAAIEGYVGLAKQLLDAGARVNARGARERGRTALEGAAENGKLDMVELLLDHGALTVGPGRSQFIRAIQFAERNGYGVTAALLRRSREWTDEDSHMYETVRPLCEKCPSQVPWYDPDRYCCDEIHRSGDGCIHDYTESEERRYAKLMRKSETNGELEED
ncbi:hypothetical protein ACJZ2D_003110 [Fusarium nematophilum]